MKIHVVRDGKGEVLASFQTQIRDEVPVEPELDEGQEMEEMEVSLKELIDLPTFYKTYRK